MSGFVRIARCSVHGLHGERTDCFVCGGPVEQVEMIPATEHADAMRQLALTTARVAVEEMRPEMERYALLKLTVERAVEVLDKVPAGPLSGLAASVTSMLRFGLTQGANEDLAETGQAGRSWEDAGQ